MVRQLVSLLLLTCVLTSCSSTNSTSNPTAPECDSGGPDCAPRESPTESTPPGPARAQCLLFGVEQRGPSDSQLFTIDLRTRASQPLGEAWPRADLVGIAIHPVTLQLYAISGKQGAQPGQLFIIDGKTGAPTPVGPVGLDDLSGLTFRPTDGTLWTWAKNSGLVQLDVAHGTGTLRFASQVHLDDLAWSRDGSTLYGSEHKTLWSYTPGTGQLAKQQNKLPGKTEALALRPDDQLLGVQKSEESIAFFTFNPSLERTTATYGITAPYPQTRAIAWPTRCGNPSPGGRAELIKNVSLSKTSVCAGESFEVTVTTEHPEGALNPVNVAINGTLGATQLLQFGGAPGPRLLTISATTAEHYSDSRQLQVEIKACDHAPRLPLLDARIHPYRDMTVDLTVSNASELGLLNPSYEWSFGDGHTAHSDFPYVAHSYADVLPADEVNRSFEVTLTIQQPGRPAITARRTVSLWNMYAFNKSQGLIQPRVDSNGRVERVGSSLVGTFTLHNIEAEPLTLTSRQIQYHACEAGLDPTVLPPESHLLVVGAGQRLDQSISVPADAVPVGACQLSLHLAGTLPNQANIAVAVYFTLRQNPLTMEQVNDPAMRSVLNQIVAQGMVAGDTITDEDLHRLSREGRIPFTIKAVPGAPIASRLRALGADPIGERCLPDDAPPRPGITCQVTDEWDYSPPYIANGLKGDIILSADCGSIGKLLQKVSPAQAFSHSGIMIRNYYALHNSTTVEGRFAHYPHGGGDLTEGIRSDVLQYGWPGNINQSIDQAYNGHFMNDPETSREYSFRTFGATEKRCNGMVLSPRVLRAAPEFRPLARAAADVAKDIQGHYRFYSYSDATISLKPDFFAPSSSGWAVGTRPTVCSSTIWTAFKLLSTPLLLEGDLEPEEVARGAWRDPTTEDGLYYYTDIERREAAQVLYSELHNAAYDQAGWLGEFLTDAADDVANQVVNCFASDDCGQEAKDSDAWMETGAGRAVSPNDLLFWDAFKYNEPLVYRNGAYGRVHRWAPSADSGTVVVRVLEGGLPTVGAEVVFDTQDPHQTNTQGEVEFVAVPSGLYEVVATKLINGLLFEVRDIVEVTPGASKTVVLTLQPPPKVFRRVTITGTMFLVDHDTDSKNETRLIEILDQVHLSPYDREGSIHISECVDDEVRGEVTVNLRLLDDNVSVHVSSTSRLFEGDTCDTDEEEDNDAFSETLARDSSTVIDQRLTNPFPTGGEDSMDLDLTIINAQQP
jgi:hypothetical protein